MARVYPSFTEMHLAYLDQPDHKTCSLTVQPQLSPRAIGIGNHTVSFSWIESLSSPWVKQRLWLAWSPSLVSSSLGMLLLISLPTSSGRSNQSCLPRMDQGCTSTDQSTRRLVFDTVLYGIVICQFINWSIHKGRTESKMTRYLVASPNMLTLQLNH